MLLRRLTIGISIAVATAAPILENHSSSGINSIRTSSVPTNGQNQADANVISKREETKQSIAADSWLTDARAHGISGQSTDSPQPLEDSKSEVYGTEDHELPLSEHPSYGQVSAPAVTLASTNDPPISDPLIKEDHTSGSSKLDEYGHPKKAKKYDPCDSGEPEEEDHKKKKHPKKPKHYKKPIQVGGPNTPEAIANTNERIPEQVWKRNDLVSGNYDELDSHPDEKLEDEHREDDPALPPPKEHYDVHNTSTRKTAPSIVGLTGDPALPVFSKKPKMHKCPSKKKHKPSNPPVIEDAGTSQDTGHEFDQGRLAVLGTPLSVSDAGYEQKEEENLTPARDNDRDAQDETDYDVPKAWLVPPPAHGHARSVKRALRSRMTIGYGPFGYGSSSITSWDHQGHDIDSVDTPPKPVGKNSPDPV